MKKLFAKTKQSLLERKTGTVVMLALFALCTVAALGSIVTTYATSAEDTVYLADVFAATAENPYHKELSMFAGSYAPESSASSSDGAKIIAPGTSGSEKLILRNNYTDDAKLHIVVRASIANAPKMGGSTLKTPVMASISQLASSSNYESLDDLKNNPFTKDVTIAKGADSELYIDWAWNTISDEQDTKWGDSSAKVSIIVELQVESIDPPPTPHRKDSGSSQDMKGYENPTGNPVVTEGEWVLIDDVKRIWKFIGKDSGKPAKDGFYYANNPYSTDIEKNQWFYFDKDGIMQIGWILADNGEWYYADNLGENGNYGQLKTGWHLDPQDNRVYYMHNSTRQMLEGWQCIDGYYYYFAKTDDVPGMTWAYDSLGSSMGKWLYDFFGARSHGSLYVSEITPDGRRVDKYGRLIGEDGKPMHVASEPGDIATAVTVGVWIYDEANGEWYYDGYDRKPLFRDEWAYIYNPYANEAGGQPVAGWFHFDKNGVMQTGWNWILSRDGYACCYYLQEKSDGIMGICYMDTVVGGSQINSQGKWIKSGKIQIK